MLMRTCDLCGKGSQRGRNIRHAHTGQWEKRASKTRRIFKPNIHKGKVLIDGVARTVRACASCLARHKFSPARKGKNAAKE
jgi:large subunit ribosomal protein L28